MRTRKTDNASNGIEPVPLGGDAANETFMVKQVTKTIREYLADIGSRGGKKGGKASSKAKTDAARENGKKGGYPKGRKRNGDKPKSGQKGKRK